MTQTELDEILKNAKKSIIQSGFLTSIVLAPFSIVVAKFGLNKNINPNIITLGMLISVLCALPFFYFNAIWGVVIGLILIQAFEICDDADGIVARGSGKLSIYGEQLDYLMHLICHPLAIITYGYAIYIALPAERVFYFIDNLHLMFILCAIFIITEYAIRNFIHLDSITKLKMQIRDVESSTRHSQHIVKKIINHFILFPFFMQVFPIFLLIDLIFNINISIWVFIVAVVLWIIFSLFQVLKRFIKYMR